MCLRAKVLMEAFAQSEDGCFVTFVELIGLDGQKGRAGMSEINEFNRRRRKNIIGASYGGIPHPL